jgi:hypothetical protein
MINSVSPVQEGSDGRLILAENIFEIYFKTFHQRTNKFGCGYWKMVRRKKEEKKEKKMRMGKRDGERREKGREYVQLSEGTVTKGWHDKRITRGYEEAGKELDVITFNALLKDPTSFEGEEGEEGVAEGAEEDEDEEAGVEGAGVVFCDVVFGACPDVVFGAVVGVEVVAGAGVDGSLPNCNKVKNCVEKSKKK